ncbi:hypothetical protein D3C78_1634530 [compost metagenome]
MEQVLNLLLHREMEVQILHREMEVLMGRGINRGMARQVEICLLKIQGKRATTLQEAVMAMVIRQRIKAL